MTSIQADVPPTETQVSQEGAATSPAGQGPLEPNRKSVMQRMQDLRADLEKIVPAPLDDSAKERARQAEAAKNLAEAQANRKQALQTADETDAKAKKRVVDATKRYDDSRKHLANELTEEQRNRALNDLKGARDALSDAKSAAIAATANLATQRAAEAELADRDRRTAELTAQAAGAMTLLKNLDETLSKLIDSVGPGTAKAAVEAAVVENALAGKVSLEQATTRRWNSLRTLKDPQTRGDLVLPSFVGDWARSRRTALLERRQEAERATKPTAQLEDPATAPVSIAEAVAGIERAVASARELTTSRKRRLDALVALVTTPVAPGFAMTPSDFRALTTIKQDEPPWKPENDDEAATNNQYLIPNSVWRGLAAQFAIETELDDLKKLDLDLRALDIAFANAIDAAKRASEAVTTKHDDKPSPSATAAGTLARLNAAPFPVGLKETP